MTSTDLISRAVLTDEPIAASVFPNGWDGTVPEVVVDSKDFRVSEIRLDDFGEIWAPDPDGLGTTGFPSGLAPEAGTQKASDAGINSTTSQEINIAQSRLNVFHPGVPDINQGFNECVPTSTANSLLWLAKIHNFEGKMPDTTADLISELKSDFAWARPIGVFVAKPFNNPTGNGYLSGKQRFINRHDIPIETHQIGNRFDVSIQQKINAELEKGQDVEIDMEFQGPAGSRTGGHMVTVVGAVTLGGEKFLDCHDPSSPSGTLDIYRIDGTRVVYYRFQGPYVTYIRFAIAESPFVPPASFIADNSVSCRITLTWKDNTESEDGFLIERRESGSQTWTQIASVGQNVTSYTNAYVTDGTLRGGVTYCYRVRAYKGTNYSTYSTESCAVKQ